jgi:hypothetical protein
VHFPSNQWQISYLIDVRLMPHSLGVGVPKIFVPQLRWVRKCRVGVAMECEALGEARAGSGLRRVPELPRFVWHVTDFRCVTEALASGA